MKNLFDYIEWRADLPFSEAPQNKIDGLIFAELSYIPFEKIVPSLKEGTEITLSEASRLFFELHGEEYSLGAILPKEILLLLRACAKSVRFANVKLWGYINEICLDVEKQFSAICFSCDNKVTYIAFRGTDDTIIGWKEDLNMALFTPIPSQREGLKYLDGASKKRRDKLIIVGHSKGGNIAVYTALNASASLKNRMICVYSYDGPGFKNSYLKTFADDTIVEKITTFLPSKSFVGRIFDVIGNYEIVKSRDNGLQQHDAFTWQVLGSQFIKAEKFETPSDNFHELLKAWVSKLTPMERRDFVESFYKLLTVSGAETLTDITNKKFKFLISLIGSNGADKKVIFDAFVKLLKEKNAISTAKKKQKKQTLIEKKKANKPDNKKPTDDGN